MRKGKIRFCFIASTHSASLHDNMQASPEYGLSYCETASTIETFNDSCSGLKGLSLDILPE